MQKHQVQVKIYSKIHRKSQIDIINCLSHLWLQGILGWIILTIGLNIILDVPKPPTDVTASDMDSVSLTLSWKPPSYNGGTPITGYYVERRTGFNPRWVAVNRSAVHITRMEVSDLTKGREYSFRVIAENEAGLSQPSELAGPFKAQEPYGNCNTSLFIH